MKILKYLYLAATALAAFGTAQSGTTLYDAGTIQKIEIKFAYDNWDYMLDTAKMGEDGYTMAEWVKINGIQYDSVGVKYKGNSSFDASYKKNPWNISLDEYKSQNHEGIKSIKMANCFDDPSMIREILSYNTLKNYTDCPRANFAQVYVNGSLIGLYSNTEAINKQMLADRFSHSGNVFFSCSPVGIPVFSNKSTLKYISADSTAYSDYYEVKSKFGWNELVALCDSASNHPENIESIVDMDRLCWMLAFDNLFVNLDSYIGVFGQNYYLYKDNSGRFMPIVWDLNMSLGGFPFVGSSNTGMGALSIDEMKVLSPEVHSKDANWPLIKAVMSNSTYKNMYYAHLRTMLNEQFVSGKYAEFASTLQALIDTAVVSDTNKFFTYEDFKAGMTQDKNVGSYSVPGINNLMTPRIAFLQSHASIAAAAPVIAMRPASYSVSDSIATITATITGTNESAPFVGYRNSKKLKFEKARMYDDGQHGDAEAGDGIFGVQIKMILDQTQYYAYAENASAGAFSPERAEHEYYTISSSVSAEEPTPAGFEQITIAPMPVSNEFVLSAPSRGQWDYSIVNEFGCEVLSGHFSDSALVNIEALPSGVYFAIARNESTTIKKKFVKE